VIGQPLGHLGRTVARPRNGGRGIMPYSCEHAQTGEGPWVFQEGYKQHLRNPSEEIRCGLMIPFIDPVERQGGRPGVLFRMLLASFVGVSRRTPLSPGGTPKAG